MSRRQARERGVVQDSPDSIDLAIRDCAETLGITTLVEWDVLNFIFQHATSLVSAEQIARLVGYGTGPVGFALDKLELGGLIERSRASREVRMYRFAEARITRLEGSFTELLKLAGGRAGRLQLMRNLRPPRGRKDDRATWSAQRRNDGSKRTGSNGN